MKKHTNKRILVIDDNAAIHQDFKKVLLSAAKDTELESVESFLFGQSDEGVATCSFQVDSAYQGEEGLAKVVRALEEQRPYAMAFIDVRMPPGWDGIETISRIWAIYPELQVVLCTAYSDYSWEQVAGILRNLDSLLILKKPFDNIEVLQLAHGLTSKWALTQQVKHRMDDLELIVQARTSALQTANENLKTEILERAQTEVALRRTEERFSKAFEASPIPMAILTVQDQRFENVNESFLRMTGHRREEVIGRTTAQLEFWPAGSIERKLPTLVRTHKPIHNLECPIRTKAGDRRETLASVDLVTLGDEPHLLLITQDISDLLVLEHQLRQSQKMEAVGQLAAGIAHDFNNLLTVIQGHTALRLAQSGPDQVLGESLQQIGQAADRASALTRQLLAFSRKQIMQPKPLCLNTLIDHLTEMLQRIIGEHIQMESDPAAALPCVYADACNIEQVIMNLAVNARDAMPQGGRLILRTRLARVEQPQVESNPEAREGEFVCLTITDEGCGMDTSIRRRAFEPFFTTKPVGQGTGMGLATVYGIIKQHRGWIEIETSVSHGTTFRVYLPVTEEVSEPADTKPTPAALLGGHETVLLVEDEPMLRELGQTVLATQGYNVLTAERATDALLIWGQHPRKIDLLFTDMVMPGGMNGRELAEQLKVENPGLKVIYSSGYSQEMIGNNFVGRQGAKFLAKPYRPPELVRLVREVLDEQESEPTSLRKTTETVS